MNIKPEINNLKTKILLFGNFYPGNVAQELFLFFLNNGSNVFMVKRNLFNKPFSDRYLNRLVNFFFKKCLEIILNIYILYKILKIKPDVFFVVKGLNVYPITFLLIKKKSLIVNWNLDDFFNFKNSNTNLIKSIKYFD